MISEDKYSRSNEDKESDHDENDELGFSPPAEETFDPFMFEPIDLNGLPKTEKIRRYVAGEETRIIVTESNRIYRRRVKKDAEFVGYELPDPRGENLITMLKGKEKQATIKGIYMDPRGVHCLISTETLQHCYFHYKDTKIRNLHKIKGLNIKCLSFYNPHSQTSTGQLLIASDNGVLSLYKIDIRDELIESIVPSVMQLPTTSDILSIEIYRLQQTAEAGGKMLVTLFTTSSSIFCITGPDELGGHFRRFEDRSLRVKEVVPERGYNSMGQTCYNKYTKRPTAYLWTNGKVLRCFRIPQKTQRITDSFINSCQTLKFAKRSDIQGPSSILITQTPTNIGLSDFHYYLLFTQSLTIMNRVTQKLIKHHQFKSPLIDMYYDSHTPALWIYSHTTLHRLDLNREDREQWKVLIEKGRFREAYEVEKVLGENLDYVAGIYADSLFNKGEYLEAAGLYFDAGRTFEEIVIKLMMVDGDRARQALEFYLRAWLSKLLPEQTTQRCVLLAWLIQLLIFRLNTLQRRLRSSPKQTPPAQLQHLRSLIAQKQLQLQLLLKQNLQVLDESLVYSIMQSHGRTNNIVRFAEMKNNFEMIILHHINQEDYRQAIRDLRKVRDKRVVEVVYKYAHIFFREVTEETIELLIRTVQDFKPGKLVAGFINIPAQKRQLSIQLIKYCIMQLKSRQKSIHNILIFLYATTARKDKDKQQFLEFLKSNKLNFDVEFALRLFKRNHLYQAQITVYGMMGLYGQAVSLALENGKFNLAKEYAEKPEYDDVRKKLWVAIARNLLLQGKNVNEVVSLTSESSVLKIQDLLPFFNEKIRIADFKDEICNELKNYSEEIERLRKQMDKFASSAEKVKNQLSLAGSRYLTIDTTAKCQDCNSSLFTSQYFIFPCLHGFHIQCLASLLRRSPIVDTQRHQKLLQLSSQIESLRVRLLNKNRRTGLPTAPTQQPTTSNFSFKMFGLFENTNTKKKEEDQEQTSNEESLLGEKKKEYEGLLARECVCCGPSLADTIMMPFCDERERESWRVGWGVERM